MLPPHPALRIKDLQPFAAGPTVPELLKAGNVRTFYNARAVLFHLARALSQPRRPVILVPAFHCPSVVEPLLRGGAEPRFYRVDRKLRVDLEDVQSKISGDVCAALFINYFGLPSQFEPLLPELRAREVVAIEDCAHSFLAEAPLRLAGRRADAAIYSFWKLVPSAVGGGLWVRPGVDLRLPMLRSPPLRDSLVRAKDFADEMIDGLDEQSILRQSYAVAMGAVRRLRAVGSRGRASSLASPSAPAATQGEYRFVDRLAHSRLPWLDAQILARADLPRISAARRRNFLRYAEDLQDSRLLSQLPRDLPEQVCPWAYPFVLRDRSMHDRRLRELGVPVWTFGNVLHRAMDRNALGAAGEDAAFLADNLLCLPVHQMLEETDVRNFARQVNDYCWRESA